MKRKSNFFPEMNRTEIEAYLKGGSKKVIVVVGSTEQHGPHLPVSTDVLIPLEVARRVAPEIDALIAPPIVFGLSSDHKPAGGVISLRLSTLSALVMDVTTSLAEQGFREIVFLNGHYSNAWTILHSINEIQQQLPKDTFAFGLQYWDALPADQSAEFMGPTTGVHAAHAETAAVLGIDENLVDMGLAPVDWPEFPELRTGVFTILNSYCLTRPGSLLYACNSGTWGDATKATVADGQKFLKWFTKATVDMIRDIEDTYAKWPQYRPRT
jgi:creatinine amidohydrolase